VNDSSDSGSLPPEDAAAVIDRLRSELATREEILAVVAHDLRSPLNVLTMGMEILRHTMPAGNDKNLERMRRAMAAMNDLVTNLVDMSHLGNSRAPASITIVYAEILLRDVLSIQKPVLQRCGLNIEVETRSGLHPLSADYERLLRVFADLINHAVRKAEAGSTIRLTARNVEGLDLPMGASRGVEFSVSHVGETVLETANDMNLSTFFRLPPAERQLADLGLAIARSIIEAHGGRILNSRQPEGEPIIRFCLPSPGAG